ncbi:MAG: hypothetical protein JNL57_11890 [Bacteroidetes bacterium]|nr:hypothetical protein [Bacteroidota bacterium]
MPPRNTISSEPKKAYAFGSTVKERTISYTKKYRFGFNNQEQETELGDYYSFEYRVHDARLGRFLSVDPWEKKYAFQSPYNFAFDRPIIQIDWKGCGGEPKHGDARRVGGCWEVYNKNLITLSGHKGAWVGASEDVTRTLTNDYQVDYAYNAMICHTDDNLYIRAEDFYQMRVSVFIREGNNVSYGDALQVTSIATEIMSANGFNILYELKSQEEAIGDCTFKLESEDKGINANIYFNPEKDKLLGSGTWGLINSPFHIPGNTRIQSGNIQHIFQNSELTSWVNFQNFSGEINQIVKFNSIFWTAMIMAHETTHKLLTHASLVLNLGVNDIYHNSTEPNLLYDGLEVGNLLINEFQAGTLMQCVTAWKSLNQASGILMIGKINPWILISPTQTDVIRAGIMNSNKNPNIHLKWHNHRNTWE